MTSDPVWRAVADPTRRRLIELLRGGPRTTGDLCRAFPTTRFAVMKHLGVLERCGVVSVRRSGRERWNTLNPEPLRALEGRWPAAEHAVPARPAAPATAAEQGFSPAHGPSTTTVSVFIDATPWRVFDALTVNIAAWWGAPHLVAADASNLILEPQPGGRFYEEWGHRQGALRGIVAAIRQDIRLELIGTLFGVTPSTLCFVLERREDGTLLTASLSSALDSSGHEEVERGILDDLVTTRLKSFVEHGIRSGLAS
jgi:DNA-binding transcriptional ArsR family regulator/uncharacterized protein YndB with AHSA1/START domain